MYVYEHFTTRSLEDRYQYYLLVTCLGSMGTVCTNKVIIVKWLDIMFDSFYVELYNITSAKIACIYLTLILHLLCKPLKGLLVFLCPRKYIRGKQV